MRLFVAIDFPPEVKKRLIDVQHEIQRNSTGGNFTREENLHLTLVFIGEALKPDAVRRAMDAVTSREFDFEIGGFGSFGDLYWAGVNNCKALNDTYNRLIEGLEKEGFVPEKRDFKPHITLIRQLICTTRPKVQVEKMTVHASKLCLMKSERINGRLIYTQIYSKQLEHE